MKTLLEMTYNSTGEKVAVWAQFWLETVSIFPLGYLGLVGNTIAVLTLRHPTIKTTFHRSLVALAICDVLFLLMVLTDQIVDKTSLFYVEVQYIVLFVQHENIYYFVSSIIIYSTSWIYRDI